MRRNLFELRDEVGKKKIKLQKLEKEQWFRVGHFLSRPFRGTGGKKNAGLTGSAL